MTVYGYDPYLSVDAAWRISSGVVHAKEIETVYKNCDYITIHVPYTESTHHLIDRRACDDEKGVRIINLARAELVNDDDMIEAIDSGKVACYVTDFPTQKRPICRGLLQSRIWAPQRRRARKLRVMAAHQIIDYLENGNITNSVNMPAATLARTGDPRICVIHKTYRHDLKNHGAVSSCGINIENMVNAGTRALAGLHDHRRPGTGARPRGQDQSNRRRYSGPFDLSLNSLNKGVDVRC